MRRAFFAWVALTLACMAAPAEGAHVELDAQAVVVVDQAAHVLETADLLRLTVDYNVTEDVADPTGLTNEPTCEESNVTVDPERGTFAFTETPTGDGCADVRLDVPVPHGAERVVVRFDATRLVGGSAALNTGSSLVQQFRIFTADGGLAFSKDYFDDTEGTHETPEPFQFDESLGPGRTNVTLSWLFDDEGFQGEGLSSLQDFDATVGNISFEWPQVMLAPATVTSGTEEPRNATHATTPVHVRLDVPRALIGPRLQTSLSLAVRHGPVPTGLSGPLAEEELDALTQVDDGSVLRIGVPSDILARQGAGAYGFDFQTVRALPPPPAPVPPSEPTRAYVFFFALVFLPAIAAGLALQQSTVFVRQSEDPYRRTARGVRWVVVALVAYYALLVLYAFLVLGARHMATLPLSRESVLVYAQWGLLLLAFSAIALLVSRTLIREMRRDLEDRARQQEQLRRSNEELERFAYVASHDLQEPLRKVAGFTALLQKRYAGRLDKDADEIIEYAVDGATRMQALIKDILAYSRVAGKELQRAPVDANLVMELISSDLAPLLAERKARLAWTALPTVRADASQLRQLLQNLVENGVKYAQRGRAPVIRVSAEREGEGWHFLVKDNGIGIPADKHEEVFGIFRRLQTAQPGTGIGLAIAKKVVERHGGSIWVESKPGRGSTFHFTLPHTIVEPASPRAAATREPVGKAEVPGGA